MSDNIKDVAETLATYMGQMVNEDQLPPGAVLMGGIRACIAFWGGCVPDGNRVEAMNVFRQAVNEELDYMVRGMANGMVPA